MQYDMEYLLYVCQSSSLLPWPPSLGGYNLLQLRPHLWMNVISPQRCFLGRKVYQDSQHMKGEGIQEKICLSSWGLYPLLLRKVPCNLPVIKRLWCHFLQNLAPSKSDPIEAFFGLAAESRVAIRSSILFFLGLCFFAKKNIINLRKHVIIIYITLINIFI